MAPHAAVGAPPQRVAERRPAAHERRRVLWQHLNMATLDKAACSL